MNIERLTKLAELLYWVAAEHKPFDLTVWINDQDPYSETFDPQRKAGECGTAACAVGYAACDPWFNAQGLSLVDGEPAIRDVEEGWDSVEIFFDLGEGDARHLFCSSRYCAGPETGPSQVATRIREFIASETQA